MLSRVIWSFAGTLVALMPQADGYSQNEPFFLPSGSVVVAVNPDALLGEGLSRAWRKIDEPNGKLRVQSKPLSKVYFQLATSDSFDGAMINVQLEGSSAGVTHTTSDKFKISTDSLTLFNGQQSIFIDSNGCISASAPMIQVDANQSFSRASAEKSKLSAALAGFAYRKFPRDVQQRAQTFAYQQITKQLRQSIKNLQNNLSRSLNEFAKRRPAIANLDWHMTSDSRNIYLTTFSDTVESEHPIEATEMPNAPINVIIEEHFVTDQARTRLADRTFESDGLSDLFNFRSDRNGKDSSNEDKSEKDPWFITFASKPMSCRFGQNEVHLRFNIEEFKTENRSLNDLSIETAFEIKQENQKWLLERVGETKILSESSGARQKIVRSIVKKRVDKILPSRIALPELENFDAMNEMDLELGIKSVATTSNSVLVSIDHK